MRSRLCLLNPKAKILTSRHQEQRKTPRWDQANTRLDAVYKRLMGKLDADGQKALKEAERSWIKWRDDEVMLIARVGGAVGGSGMRVDFANAQLKLINQRIEVLSEYLKQSSGN